LVVAVVVHQTLAAVLAEAVAALHIERDNQLEQVHFQFKLVVVEEIPQHTQLLKHNLDNHRSSLTQVL
jgi:hypothetical protein|tara:strand:+ start:275 stop:478 length:204 start_codon:yes stop_codon:yes gene_type:complete